MENLHLNVPSAKNDAPIILEPLNEGPQLPLHHERPKLRPTLSTIIEDIFQRPGISVEDDPEYQRAFSHEKDEALKDDDSQREGFESFQRFRRNLKTLDNELQIFSSAMGQLSTSVRLLYSASQLDLRLAQLLLSFEENAANLFPRVKKYPNHEGSITRHPTSRSRGLDDLPSQLDELANDLEEFLDYVNDISGFRDKAFNTSVGIFQRDLRYRALCLEYFEDQFSRPAIERYLHDIMVEVGERTIDISSAMAAFVKRAIPVIRSAQQYYVGSVQNLSTVATFFSAVTATMIQFSYQDQDTRLEQAVNLFWVISLIFSVSSAINSQLTLHWRRKPALYRRVRGYVPWWIFMWTFGTALLFLVISVIAFMAGLVCFTFSTFGSHPFMTTTVTVCVSISSLVWLVAPWFVWERGFSTSKRSKRWFAQELMFFLRTWKAYIPWLRGRHPFNEREQDDILAYLPSLGDSSMEFVKLEVHPSGVKARQPNRPAVSETIKPIDRFRVAARQVLMAQRAFPLPPIQYGSESFHLGNVVSALRKFAMKHDEPSHGRLVRHLQFSHSGKFLATCSWDGTAKIWKLVDETLELQHSLRPQEGNVEQVEWSPDDRHLLTKMKKVVTVWISESGVPLRTVSRGQYIPCVAWMPRGNRLLFVEDPSVYVLDLETAGHAPEKLNFPPLLLRKAVVGPDGNRLFAVGVESDHSDDNAGGAKIHHKEKRILVLSMHSKKIESQVPVLTKVRDISLSHTGDFLLVSYKNKPSQLFHVKNIHDKAQLFLQRTYHSPKPIEFAGPSYFGQLQVENSKDHIVLCAGTGGDIYIWDRETARTLYSSAARTRSPELTGIAWNRPTATSWMFATAAHDGAVQIWTAPWAPDEYRVSSPR